MGWKKKYEKLLLFNAPSSNLTENRYCKISYFRRHFIPWFQRNETFNGLYFEIATVRKKWNVKITRYIIAVNVNHFPHFSLDDVDDVDERKRWFFRSSDVDSKISTAYIIQIFRGNLNMRLRSCRENREDKTTREPPFRGWQFWKYAWFCTRSRVSR